MSATAGPGTGRRWACPFLCWGTGMAARRHRLSTRTGKGRGTDEVERGMVRRHRVRPAASGGQGGIRPGQHTDGRMAQRPGPRRGPRPRRARGDRRMRRRQRPVRAGPAGGAGERMAGTDPLARLLPDDRPQRRDPGSDRRPGRSAPGVLAHRRRRDMVVDLRRRSGGAGRGSGRSACAGRPPGPSSAGHPGARRRTARTRSSSTAN